MLQSTLGAGPTSSRAGTDRASEAMSSVTASQTVKTAPMNTPVVCLFVFCFRFLLLPQSVVLHAHYSLNFSTL